MPTNTRRFIKDMPANEQPLYRVRNLGADVVSSAELIATVLQRRDGLDLAYDLLSEFGSLAGIRIATEHELSKIPGLGVAGSARLKAAFELGTRLQKEEMDERRKVTSPSDVAELLMSDMMFLEQEELRVVLLNTRNEIIGVETIYKGNVNTSVIRISEIMRAAVRVNAPAMIIAHNHPSGDPSPSPEDISITRKIIEAGELMDINVLDHVVIGRQRFVSMKERGLGFYS